MIRGMTPQVEMDILPPEIVANALVMAVTGRQSIGRLCVRYRELERQ